MKILVVDDEEVIRDSLTGFLMTEGHECRVAKNGLEALRLIEDEVPQVVFADVRMPFMGGLTLLDLINQLYPSHSIHVIIITGHANNEEEIQAVRDGAAAIIQKPLSTDEILHRLNALNEERDVT